MPRHRSPRSDDQAPGGCADAYRTAEAQQAAQPLSGPAFTSWVINSGRNFEAKPSTKSLFAYTAAQCARRSASSSNFPEMDKLIDRAGVGLEIADELLVLPALLKRRKAKFLIELQCGDPLMLACAPDALVYIVT
jgi:hypothetical protein